VKLAPEILGDGKLHLPPELLGGGPDAKAITLHPKVKLAPEILGDGKPPKVPVDADTSKMAGQIQSAAKQVKVHGLTVSLSDAKLSGLAALDSTMAAAGKAAGKALDTAMAQAVQAGGSQVTGDARQVAAQVKAALAGLRAAGDAAGASLDAGLAAGITAGEGSVVAAATAVAQAAEQAVKAAAGIHSPSKVWQSMGDEMVTGLVGALENGKATVAEAARELAGAAGKPLQDDIKAALAYGRLVASSARSFAALPGIKVSRAGPDGGYEPESAQLETGLRHRLWSIRDFTGELGRLRGEGLSQALLRQVTSAGPGSALAREMAGASAKTIAEMNRTEREIIQASRRSGAVAAGDRYGHAGYAATASRLNVSLGDLRADITLIIDGKKVSRSVQSATLQRAHRNTSSGLQLQGRNP